MALCKSCRGRGWHSLGIYGWEQCDDCQDADDDSADQPEPNQSYADCDDAE
jgi:hypothetical protein